MNVSVSSSWQGLYLDAKEKVSYGCSVMYDSAKIVGESIGFLGIHVVSLICPSFPDKYQALCLKVYCVWQKIKSHFEKKKLKEEIRVLKDCVATLEGDKQTLTLQLSGANQQIELLLRQMGALRSSYELVQQQRDLYQQLAAQTKANPSEPIEGAPCRLDSQLEKQVQQFLNQNPPFTLTKA